jgi:hypothetical protein
LWFYRDSADSILPNASFETAGSVYYYGRFGQRQFSDSVDLLRNEEPVYFYWNDASKGVFLATSEEAVGEGEADLP